MSDAAHTPTPWRKEFHTDLKKWVVTGSDGRLVGSDDNEANAALIVRAVNNHVDLVAALNATADELEDADPTRRAAIEFAREVARKALAERGA